MLYSVQPIDQTFVKGCGFLSFAKNMGKIVGKNIIKTRVVKTVRDFLIILSNLLQIQLKLLQK